MRVATALLVGVLGLAAAHGARELAKRPNELAEEPYAPSARAAPIVSLGFHEVGADLMWIRLTGYFGSQESTSAGIAALVEALVALDPTYHRVYDYGARAMTMSPVGVDQTTFHRALSVLERGMQQFPDDWKLPYLAGQIYTQDLVTTDPAQRRAWDDQGTALTESAIRKPGAPPGAATWVAFMRSKLGQRDRAITGLREMLLVARTDDARAALLERLAKLEGSDSAELAAEIFEQRAKFDRAWLRDRPTIPATMYILLGPHGTPGFDMADLATGGAELVGTTTIEKLEPIE